MKKLRIFWLFVEKSVEVSVEFFQEIVHVEHFVGADVAYARGIPQMRIWTVEPSWVDLYVDHGLGLTMDAPGLEEDLFVAQVADDFYIVVGVASLTVGTLEGALDLADNDAKVVKIHESL